MLPHRLVLAVCLMTLVGIAAGCAGSFGGTGAKPPDLIRPNDSWIEVDLARQLVILHEAGQIIAEYPASSGVSSAPTPPGLYRVQMMEKGPDENVSGVFVSDILVFDLGKEIGIHSMPMDAAGNVLDATLGSPSTGGCVRVGESARVFEFAEMGMRIWVH